MVLININTKQNLSLAFGKKFFALKKRVGPPGLAPSVRLQALKLASLTRDLG
jgi:hypothetical protein